MNRDILTNEYFNWMCDLVCDKRYCKKLSYRKLLSYLHNRDFIYILDMDGNRSEDGIDLRYRFAYEHNYSYPMVTNYLDDRQCSILEMMVALAIRCEDSIMADSDIGNRTGLWFWSMIKSLGLDHMSDANFDKDAADEIIDRFLDREYEPNGKGGLFTIEHCKYDLRSVDIWYQMMFYLDEI